jgi:hypothetical protein
MAIFKEESKENQLKFIDRKGAEFLEKYEDQRIGRGGLEGIYVGWMVGVFLFD